MVSSEFVHVSSAGVWAGHPINIGMMIRAANGALVVPTVEK